MKYNEEELEHICSNCNYYFPASMEDPTEYGICLHDEVFEPYIEEIIENYNYNSCQKLIEEKKFLSDTKACKHFEEIEEVEIDDNSTLGREIQNLKKTGKLNSNAIEKAILLDKFDKIDWKTISVDNYVAQLNNPDKYKQLQAAETLGGLGSLGNEQAFIKLIEYFKKLPFPSTLDEVHFKVEVFRYIGFIRNKSVIIPHLIDELYQIQSNNTTRQWISKILQYLEFCPINIIQEPLDKLLKEKKLSYRMKNKIKKTIFISKVNSN